jgi:hypothetical protein
MVGWGEGSVSVGVRRGGGAMSDDGRREWGGMVGVSTTCGLRAVCVCARARARARKCVRVRTRACVRVPYSACEAAHSSES